ncbi:MAG: hypothetical protein ACRDT8_00720 [Micromonosporaceae bacterium]
MYLNRRATLARMAVAGLGTGLTLAGCSWIDGEPEPPHPLLGVLSGARDLSARHRATLKAHPNLADRLHPLRDNHRTHMKQLVRLIGAEAASPSPSGSGSPAAAPEREEAALNQLRRAERDAAEAAVTACLKAPADHAGLVGSIAACRFSHWEVLR